MQDISAVYAEDYEVLGTYGAVAKKHGVNESTVRRSLQRRAKRNSADPVVSRAMADRGMEIAPHITWIKTQEKDEHGNTYSFMVKNDPEPEAREDRLHHIDQTFRNMPAVKLPQFSTANANENLLGFIPLNDLHGGLYAWAEETGYDDWDLGKATQRLEGWVGNLIRRMPVCGECVLFYNGDTLHANGNEPFTPASKHILDTDSRQFKVVDAIAASIIATADMAAQKHKHVRLVIKRGNHDEDAYLALLMAAKWRYREQKNITVELDPRAYWAYEFGKVFLFGHHGDRVKPQDLVMKMAADHPEEWGRTRYRFVWTGHLHQKASDTFHGARWERASCITAPDAYGAAWGNHAEATAVVYHKEKGEYERHSVRP